MSALSPRRSPRLAALALVAVAALAGPCSAQATPKGGGSGSKVTCEGYGGGEPGDVVTTTVVQFVNGKQVAETTVKHICGKDGKWHTVALVAGGGTATGGTGASSAVATAARARR